MRVCVCEWMSAAVRNRGRRRESVDLWMVAWGGCFAKRSCRLTQLARCTALCTARRSGGPNRDVSGARVGRCAVVLGDPRVSLDASGGLMSLSRGQRRSPKPAFLQVLQSFAIHTPSLVCFRARSVCQRPKHWACSLRHIWGDNAPSRRFQE